MKNLSTKLTVIMLSICVVGMGCLSLISIMLFRSSLIETSLDVLGESTSKEMERISGWFQNHLYYVDSFAMSLSMQDSFTKDEILPMLQARKADSEYFDVYMGRADGMLIMSTGYEPDYIGGFSVTKRPWYQAAMQDPGETAISSIYAEIETKTLCIPISQAIIKNEIPVGVASIDLDLATVDALVQDSERVPGSYTFLTDADGYILSHPVPGNGPSADGTLRHLSEIDNGGKVWEQFDHEGSILIHSDDGVSRYYTSRTIPDTGWKLYTAIPTSAILSPVRWLVFLVVLISFLILTGATLLIYFAVHKLVVQPVHDLTRAASELAEGGVDIKIKRHYDDEIGALINSFSHMAESIREQVGAAELLARGDLTGSAPVRSEKDIMGKTLNTVSTNLNAIISDISNTSMQIASGSQEISGSTQVLAQGATEQAATIRELSASFGKIVDKLHASEGIVEATREASREIVGSVDESTQYMQQMVFAVNEISEASSSILNVIRVIDDIAFQTNILALNAAVEAARAGSYGKGFAVVADEVRNLASKSAEAARETGRMIDEAVARASDGERIAGLTNQSLQKISNSIGRATDLIRTIVSSSSDQTAAIEKIYEGIEQIGSVIHANATNSEECASASEALFQEATNLMKVVLKFSVDNGTSQILQETMSTPFSHYTQGSRPPSLAQGSGIHDYKPDDSDGFQLHG